MSRFLISISVGVLFSCGLAWAESYGGAQASSAAPSSMPWKGGDNQDCGQSCLYQKANENIGLQAQYLYEKVMFLKSTNDAAVRHSNLKEFCLPAESADQCVNRFKMMAVSSLRKMRKAIIQNSDAAAKLKARLVDVDGRATSGSPIFARPAGGKKTPQVPYVITYDDLKKHYADVLATSSNSYQDWKEARPFAPSKDEFVKFKEIYVDPDNKERGKMMVAVTKPDGTLDYDEAAYSKAVAKYEQDLKAMNHQMANFNTITSLYRTDFEQASGTESRQAFNEARIPLIDASNRGIQSGNVITFGGGQERQPAAQGATGGTGARRTVTGTEQVARPVAVEGNDRRFTTFIVTPGYIDDRINEILN